MFIETLQGDCREILKTLPDNSVNCCVTSPPYFGLRSYNGGDKEIGLEETPAEYVAALVEVFREVKRVLRSDGVVFLNLGDSYGQGKQLLGIPWLAAFALQADSWILRSEIIWHKPNPMPESVTDRPTKSHEQIFLLTKSAKYFYDADAVREPQAVSSQEEAQKRRGTYDAYKAGAVDVKGFRGKFGGEKGPQYNPAGRNKRTVWTVAAQPYSGSHFATFPEKLIEPCILAGCPAGGTVLDPFGGSGTTGRVSVKHGRNAILIELNPEYHKLINQRTDKVQVKMAI